MQINTVLLFVALLIFSTYFFLFQKHMNALTDGDKHLILNESKPGKSVNILIGVALSTSLLVDDLYVKITAITLLLVLSILVGRIHHKSLLALGINPVYVNKLKKITLLSLTSMIFFGISVMIPYINA